MAPPRGLKHRMLSSIPAKNLTDSMAEASRFMFSRGIAHTLTSAKGAWMGRKALTSVRVTGTTIDHGLSSGLRYILEEVDAAAPGCPRRCLYRPSPIGDYGELSALAAHVNYKGCHFAIHASERIREDIGKVLDLKPWFVVHMTVAEREDVVACAESDVPIVVCPRSNLFFGSEPAPEDDAGRRGQDSIRHR